MDAFDAGLDDFVAHGGGAVETAICGELYDLPSQRGVGLQSAVQQAVQQAVVLAMVVAMVLALHSHFIRK